VGELMLEETVVPIDFGQGADTKTDPKGVVAGKFLRLENGVFTNPKRIAKRNGYTSIGSFTNPVLVHGYQNELLVADQNELYSYSSNQDAKIDINRYTSVDLGRKLIAESTPTSGISDCAILGNYALYASLDTLGNVHASVMDLSTGTILKHQTVYNNFSFAEIRIKCVCLGGTTLCVVYEKSGATNFGARTVTFSGGGVVSFSAETVITTNAKGPFDIVATATGGAFVYTNTSEDVVIATLSTALAVSTATIATTVGLCDVVTIATTSNGNIWVYWTESNDAAGQLTALSIYYAVYSSALAAVLGRTLIGAQAAPYYVSCMVAKSDSATQQTLYYGLFKTNGNGSNHEIEYSNYITATSAGVVGSATLFANGVIPFSHPFTVGSNIYAVFYYRASDITVSTTATLGAAVQPTFFVIELTNLTSPPYVAARYAAGVASSYNGLYLRIPAPINVASFSSTKFYLTCGLVIQEVATASNFIAGSLGLFLYDLDFASNQANMAKNCGNVAVLNGACMQMYDGSDCVELGFHTFPEITNLAGASPFGAIADGTYDYMAIFQWIDNQGNLHQSAPSIVKAITLASGAVNQVTITVTTNFLTQKSTSFVALYRTTGAGGTTGSVFYLVGASAAPGNASPVTGATVIFIDTLADASIIANTEAYTFPASDVLENTTPPPSTVMCAHNNRLFFVDAENPETDVWYTKSGQPLVGLSPSGFMLEQLDAKYGEIIAVAEMDEKLVALKASGIIVQSGDGVNDAGSGSTFSFPQTVPSDVGCSSQKSVILTPEGLIFKSINGIYILNRALNVAYVGAEVESYNAQDVTGANLVPGKSQIRFLTSNGYTLVYDYIFKQWSTFTNHAGTSSTVWNSLYVYATTGAKVLKEAPGVYLDDATAFSLLLQTSWLHLGSVQGFQRVRRLAMLGDFVNGNSAGHNLSIAAAYDFSSTFQPAITYAFGAASASGVFQYRERLPIQKCDTVSLLIQETTTGSNAEFVDLTNISFEAAVKRGINKLPGTKSVG
jgi:hypothetical protein